jgi:hypothetical protein
MIAKHQPVAGGFIVRHSYGQLPATAITNPTIANKIVLKFIGSYGGGLEAGFDGKAS